MCTLRVGFGVFAAFNKGLQFIVALAQPDKAALARCGLWGIGKGTGIELESAVRVPLRNQDLILLHKYVTHDVTKN